MRALSLLIVGVLLMPVGSFPDVIPNVRTLTSAPDGGWTQVTDPRAVYYNGKTYFGYVDASGNIEVRTYTHATDVVSAATTLHATLDPDTHAAPSLHIRDSDKRIMAFYSAHDDTTMRLRISTNPEDISSFAAEVSLDAQIGGLDYTYPTIVQLLGEANDPIYLFYRDWQGSNTGVLCYSKSTDGGATWGAQVEVYKNAGQSAYWIVYSDGDTRIDFAVTDNHPVLSASTKIYHFYYEGGSYFESDGSSAGSPTLGPGDLTQVYDAAAGPAWPYAMTRDGSGLPRFVYGILSGATYNTWAYARWSGSAWALSTIVTAGGILEDGVASGLTMDHDDPSRVYASVLVGSYTEIIRYDTGDNGASWTPTAITSGSSVDQIHPTMVRNHAAPLALVFLSGTYASYLSFSLGIKGSRG